MGTQEVSVFCGYTRGLCFSWVCKRFLVFVGIQEVSVFRGDIRDLCSQSTQRTNKSLFVFVCVTTQSWLWLAVCKWCKIQEIHIFTFNKIYLHSRHHFTPSNCIFMQLQGIVFNQLQGNDILVNCQWNKFIKRTYIYSQKYNHSRQLYSFTESYSFQGNIFIQGKHIHSGKLYPFKEIYSFKEHIFVQV